MSEISVINREGIMIALAFMLPPASVAYVLLAEIGGLPTFGFFANVVIVAVASFASPALVVYATEEND